jgi:hypothetical protein
MKALIAVILLINCCFLTRAQYYYKDIILNRDANTRWKEYHDHKVKSVKILSFEADNQPTDGFTCEQTVSSDYAEISTHTRSALTSESLLVSHYDLHGLLKETIDTSDRFQGITLYQYDVSGHIESITNTSQARASQTQDIEKHLWQYDESGKPVGMLKIKNEKDTTYVHFVSDEKGNIVEEHATRNSINLQVIYYYYDDNRHLTDIVRFNPKAQRLLPDFIFEYDTDGRLHSMLTVPEDNNGYQKWIYEYDDQGLRWRESCFSKQKTLLGRIEYQYSFRH